MKLLSSLLKSTRLWGLAGTAVFLYLLVFVLLGKLDVSGIMPDTNAIARTFMVVWPRMPFFAVQKGPVSDGARQEIYYTVPSRQLTRQELARMEGTNLVAHPSALK